MKKYLYFIRGEEQLKLLYTYRKSEWKFGKKYAKGFPWFFGKELVTYEVDNYNITHRTDCVSQVLSNLSPIEFIKAQDRRITDEVINDKDKDNYIINMHNVENKKHKTKEGLYKYLKTLNVVPRGWMSRDFDMYFDEDCNSNIRTKFETTIKFDKPWIKLK